MKIEKTKRDRIKGALYGFAIGDAMGATTEFMSKEKIEKEYGVINQIIGGGWLDLKKGEVTDDTQMSICVMQSLMDTYNPKRKQIEKDLFRRRTAESFIQWYLSNPPDIGNQCRRSIISLMRREKIKYDDQALGNGSLMRALPCALINDIELNLSQGRLTHNNKECDTLVSAYHFALRRYLSGDESYKIVSISDESTFRLNNKYKNDVTYLGVVHYEPSGHIKNTLGNSLYWSNKQSFYEAILGPVNDGGDADTIAAISGSLAGAKFGYNKIPKEWINDLSPEVKYILDSFEEFIVKYFENN